MSQVYFDEENATADELWDWCTLEYNSTNFISKVLIDNYYERIKRIVGQFGNDMRILEVGCGAAESSDRIKSLLKEQHFEISDYDPRYVSKVKEHKKHHLITQESVYELKRPDNSFDAVFLLEVMEHLDNYELALKELFRVSRRYVILSVPNEPLWRILNLARFRYVKDWGNTPGHLNHWNASGFSRLVSKFGIVRKVYLPIPWIILVAEKHD
ncbi:MAG: hypothetical protein OHK003_19560 [Anaerolineales bacterium]